MKIGIKATRRRVGVATALVVALVGLVGSPARASVTGHQGAMDHTLVVNCTSSCDRAAATATYARITISLGQHRTKTVRTAVVRTPVSTGRTTGVHLTLPAAAMTALRHHETVRARAVTTATREGGSSTVRTTIRRLTK